MKQIAALERQLTRATAPTERPERIVALPRRVSELLGLVLPVKGEPLEPSSGRLGVSLILAQRGCARSCRARDSLSTVSLGNWLYSDARARGQEAEHGQKHEVIGVDKAAVG